MKSSNPTDALFEHARQVASNHFGNQLTRNPSLPSVQDLRTNQECAITVAAILTYAENLKGVLFASPDDSASIFAEYGLRADALCNLNCDCEPTLEVLASLLASKSEPIIARWNRLVTLLEHILRYRLLGRSTPGSLAFLKEVTGLSLQDMRVAISAKKVEPLGDPHVVESALLDRLVARSNRLEGHTKRAEIDHIYTILHSAVYPYSLDKVRDSIPLQSRSNAQMIHVFADEILQLFADNLSNASAESTKYLTNAGATWIQGQGIECRFAARNERWCWLGNRYGDCTALRSSVRPAHLGINIHETVYPWSLDPTYQILEILHNGREAMKVHLLPLVIHDTPVLMVDAIEVVPSLREEVAGRPNPYISLQLMRDRHAILEFAFKTVITIADRLGTESVFVERFSNATWIRNELESLPSFTYHVDDVERPGCDAALRRIVEHFTGVRNPRIFYELQARNCQLMDQELIRGHKQAAVLRGTPTQGRLPLRGI